MNKTSRSQNSLLSYALNNIGAMKLQFKLFFNHFDAALTE